MVVALFLFMFVAHCMRLFSLCIFVFCKLEGRHVMPDRFLVIMRFAFTLDYLEARASHVISILQRQIVCAGEHT